MAQKKKRKKGPFGNCLPRRPRWVRRASGVGWVRWGEQCSAVWLVTWGCRGVAPSEAVFQCSFSLGTSVREVNAMLYVMCECLQNREWVKRGRKGGKEKKKSAGAVNTSKVTSFSWTSLHGSAQLELLRDQSLQRHPHLRVCVWFTDFTCLRCICGTCMRVCVGGGFY